MAELEHTEQSTRFLFDISKEVKDFYETPVIFLTKKDYSDIVFNTLCMVRKAVMEGIKANSEFIIDTIVDYHLAWLHAVNDLESYKKRVVLNLDKEEVYQAISYTIDAMNHRIKYYHRYMEKNKPFLSNIEQNHVATEVEIVEDMHKEVTNKMQEKLKCFRNFSDSHEFQLKSIAEADELLGWIDKINDGLSKQLSKYVNLNVPQPQLTGDLTKTLQQIVEGIHTSDAPEAEKLITDLKQRGRELSTMIRCTADRSLEINKVIEKINVLGERIGRLESDKVNQPSAAIMALKRKREFLEQRLESLENLKTSLKSIRAEADYDYDKDIAEEDLCVCDDFYQLRIFNHILPSEERERLVTELCYLWDLAVFGERSHKSIISILSAAEMKEEFTDELGSFYVDEFSRKIYRIPGDDMLYQPNEANELVPLTDDKEHVYYYDECGRYFIDKSRQRIYKAHAKASEYMMDTSGILLKVKEEREGITYYYDNYGRYYINDEGKHIYREEGSACEYENDGLGNLVRIRSHADLLDLCPQDANVTEDFKYLKNVVGPALRQCIADCILRQPADPIKYLSSGLLKYRENLEMKSKLALAKEELEAERELIRAEERAAAERAALEALLLQGGSEASYDSNLINYSHESHETVQ